MIRGWRAFIKNIYNRKFIIKMAGGLLIVLILCYISIKDYFIFHNLVELGSIVIGFNMFIIAKNTYKVSKNRNFMFLGMAFLVISSFDLFHILSLYNEKGFDAGKYNLSIQYYLSGRYVQAVAFLLFCFLLVKNKKNLKFSHVTAFYYAVSAALFFIIFSFEVFPACYEETGGMTQFKTTSEYIMFFIFLAVAALLMKNKEKLHGSMPKFLLLSVISIGVSELCFAINGNYDGFFSILAHILKAASCYFIYKAAVETTLQKPYDMLFYRLTETNNDLEARTKELERINRKLNESKKSYQALLDFLPYAILAHCDGKFVFVNNAALKLLKYEKYSDILGRDVLECVHPNYHKMIEDRIDKVYNDRQVTDLVEIKMIAKDGEFIDVETKAVPYVFKDRKGSLEVAGDIRERKEAEKKEKALKEAKEYDNIKNEFMANISHELRTPLNVIFGAVQLIDYYCANDSVCENKQSIRKYTKSMKQNCYRMLRLVNNLIDLTKIDSGFLKLNMQNHNIISVVEDITLSVAQYVESKGVTIEFDTEVEEKYMACDVDTIERIMLNLLSNAVKFTNSGGYIWVNIYDRGDYILISVKDTGIGIPKDKLEYVFDRFRQVDKSLARNTEGSGIGLNLVKSLVELHGGTISLESRVQEGSEFIIKLPVSLSAEDEVAVTRDIPQEKVERIHIEFSDIYS